MVIQIVDNPAQKNNIFVKSITYCAPYTNNTYYQELLLTISLKVLMFASLRINAMETLSDVNFENFCCSIRPLMYCTIMAQQQLKYALQPKSPAWIFLFQKTNTDFFGDSHKNQYSDANQGEYPMQSI